MNDEALRYPIGKFTPQVSYTLDEVQANIGRIQAIPDKLNASIKRFTPRHWDTQYRDGGWTARQVVHHLADSHLNAYVRLKWTLTESTPTIKVYDEKAWAETPETMLDPVLSIALLKPLHVKWTELLKLLSADQLKREFFHPESKKNVPLDRLIALYAWHGEHHLGHLAIISNKLS
jgi:hypothetical protein